CCLDGVHDHPYRPLSELWRVAMLRRMLRWRRLRCWHGLHPPKEWSLHQTQGSSQRQILAFHVFVTRPWSAVKSIGLATELATVNRAIIIRSRPPMRGSVMFRVCHLVQLARL